MDLRAYKYKFNDHDVGDLHSVLTMITLMLVEVGGDILPIA